MKAHLLLLASRIPLATSAIAVWATSRVGSTIMFGILNFTSTSNLKAMIVGMLQTGNCINQYVFIRE